MKKISLLLAFAIMLVSCDKDTEYVEVYKTDSDYYKTALSALDWGNGTAYVIGHKSPDLDAVCSAISYAALMQQLGYRCEARMAGDANNETKFASETFGFTLPTIMTSIGAGQRLILVDHSEYMQAVDGADQAYLLQIIDHHAIGDVKADHLTYCKFLPLGSACTIVYQSYRELGATISDDIAKVLFCGILDDTSKLTKLTCTKNDSLALDALMKQLKMTQTDVDSLYHGMQMAERNFYGMTDTEIFNYDMKDYNIEGNKLRIASLDWYIDEMDDFNHRMLAVMPSIMRDNGFDMIFAKVDKHIPNPNYGNPDDPTCDDEHITAGSWILYYGEKSKYVAEQAYGKSIEEGIIYSEVKLSRKTDVVPAFTDVLTKK